VISLLLTGFISRHLRNTLMYAYTKNPHSLTSFVVLMLWMNLGFDVVAIAGDVGQMSLLSRQFTEAEAEANDLRQQLIGLGYLGVYLITAIAFLKWTHRACLNARGFGAHDMSFTPGWSVGWYFVPFLNLVRPYQAMKEIWQVSQDPQNWQLQQVSPILGWWWGLWITSNIAGQITMRSSMGAETIEQLQASTVISIAANAIGIPLCIVAIALVKSISQSQERLVDVENEPVEWS
jgi:hypothetical protein